MNVLSEFWGTPKSGSSSSFHPDLTNSFGYLDSIGGGNRAPPEHKRNEYHLAGAQKMDGIEK